MGLMRTDAEAKPLFPIRESRQCRNIWIRLTVPFIENGYASHTKSRTFRRREIRLVILP
jgi:hypothetical protein